MAHPMAPMGADTSQCPSYSNDQDGCESQQHDGVDICMWFPQSGTGGVKTFYDSCLGTCTDSSQSPPLDVTDTFPIAGSCEIAGHTWTYPEACTGFFNNRPLKCEGPFICVNEIPGRHECGMTATNSAEYGCYGVENSESEGDACPTCEGAIVTGCSRLLCSTVCWR